MVEVYGKGHLSVRFLRGSTCAEGMGCERWWVRWILRGTGTASGHYCRNQTKYPFCNTLFVKYFFKFFLNTFNSRVFARITTSLRIVKGVIHVPRALDTALNGFILMGPAPSF